MYWKERVIHFKNEKVLIFLFILLLYLITCSGHIGGDGFLTFLTIRNIILEGTPNLIELDREFNVQEFKQNFDNVYTEIQEKKNEGFTEYYSLYGLAPVIVEIPFFIVGYIIGKIFNIINPDYVAIFFVSLTNCFIIALSCLYVYLFSLSFSQVKKTSFLIAIIYGFGTMVYPYALKSNYYEPLLGFALLGACYHSFKYKQYRQNKDLLIAGIYCGLTLLTKFYSCFLLVFIVVYILMIVKKHKGFSKDIFYFIIPCIGFLTIFFIYNYYRFGSIFETGYTTESTVNLLKDSRFKVFDFSIVNTIGRIFGLLISPGKGVLLYAPILFLSIKSFKVFFKRFRIEALLFMTLFMVFFLFFSILTIWYGDWSWGPRYLFPVLSFLIIPVSLFQLPEGELFRKLKVYLIIGILIQVPAVAMNFSDYIRFTEDNGIYSNRHFSPQFSPVLGGYVQFFSGINRLVTGKSLNYPITYARRPDGIEFMPSYGFTEFKKVNMATYDRFDFWFNNGWKIFNDKWIFKIALFFVLFGELFFVYLLWKKIKILIFG